MEEFPHCDFQLPGIVAQEHGIASSITTAAFAYSRRTNQRRLEDPFYAFWSHILSSLIFDLAPEVFLAPQLTIYDAPGATDPDHSGNTVPGNTTGDGRPDFVIMAASLENRFLTNRIVGPRFPTDFMSWSSMKILVAHPLVIAELKTCAPRSATRDSFMEALNFLMDDAFDQLEDRAVHIFNSSKYQGVHTLILISACGEWWRFKVANKDAYSTAGNFFDDGGGIKRADSVRVEYTPGHPKSESKPQTKGPRPTYICRHVDDVVVKNPLFSELVVHDMDQAMPRDWSFNINFGSKASNQRMYLIHELLQNLRHELSGGGTPDYDSEVCMSSVNMGHTLTVIAAKRG
jgi:hypothetical protein